MNITDSIVRILAQDSSTAGTGFVVANGSGMLLVVTCSHVILSEASQLRGDPVPLNTRVIFSLSKQSFSAIVVTEWWSPAKDHDIAFLSVDGPLPANVIPLPLGLDMVEIGTRFRSRGFRTNVDFDSGLEATGTILGLVTHEGTPVLQLSSKHIDHGMSGAPVWDPVRHSVVGVVNSFWGTQRFQDSDLAFATPASVLQSICSALCQTATCPYRGLLSFTSLDTAFFHGRAQLTESLIEHLRVSPEFLCLVGSSGSGKSSLIQAGLLPAIRDRKVVGFRDPILISFRPLDTPMINLAAALRESGLSTSIEGDAIQALLNITERDHEQRIIVYVDQLEELFASAPPGEQHVLLGGFSQLLQSRATFSLIVTIRADFYEPLLSSELSAWLKHGQVNILPMNRTELEEAIVLPAKHTGARVEPGLVQLLIRDLEGTNNPLPLLQSALTELWKRRHDGELRVAEYDGIGGAGGAIAQWAGAFYRSLKPEQRALAKHVLTHLITYGSENIPDTRRRCQLADLTNSGDGQAVVEIIRRLAESRIVVTDSDKLGQAGTVEIIHDSLIREWPELQTWISEDRQFLLWRQRLGTRVQRWNDDPERSDELLRGTVLDEALLWKQGKGRFLSLGECEFIRRSSSQRTMESWRRAGAVVLALLIVGLYALNVLLKQHRTIALDRRLRESNLSNISLETVEGTQLLGLRPLPSRVGKQPWAPGGLQHLSQFATGANSVGLSPGYYVLDYKVGGVVHRLCLYARGYGYDPSVSVPIPPASAPEGYTFVPGGTVPSGDLLGEAKSDEAITPVVIEPYLIKQERFTARAPFPPSTSDNLSISTWRSAVDLASSEGSRLPSLLEWEWAAVLGVTEWQQSPRWEWTSTRLLPAPYDESDGRNNVHALDGSRLIVGGGLKPSDDSVPPSLAAFLQHRSSGSAKPIADMARDPTLLDREPTLKQFLLNNPEIRDLEYEGDEQTLHFAVARPTNNHPEAVEMKHAFRFARNAAVTPTPAHLESTIIFGTDSFELTPKGADVLRRFAQAWFASGHKDDLLLGGYTDYLGSAEYKLAVGENFANAVKAGLMQEGIPANAMRVFSYGKERTPDTGDLPESIYLAPSENRVVISRDGQTKRGSR